MEPKHCFFCLWMKEAIFGTWLVTNRCTSSLQLGLVPNCKPLFQPKTSLFTKIPSFHSVHLERLQEREDNIGTDWWSVRSESSSSLLNALLTCYFLREVQQHHLMGLPHKSLMFRWPLQPPNQQDAHLRFLRPPTSSSIGLLPVAMFYEGWGRDLCSPGCESTRSTIPSGHLKRLYSVVWSGMGRGDQRTYMFGSRPSVAEPRLPYQVW